MRAHTRFVSEGSYCSGLRQRDTEGQCQKHLKDRHSKALSEKKKTMLKAKLYSVLKTCWRPSFLTVIRDVRSKDVCGINYKKTNTARESRCLG